MTPLEMAATASMKHENQNQRPKMELTDYIRADMAALRKVAANDECARQIHDVMADHRLVDYASRAMAEKLAAARARGRGGWWDATDCSIELLRGMLREHLEKGDMRDIMNIAAMIYTREIADAPKPEICQNCDTALPGGCNGIFKDEGARCRWNLNANATLQAPTNPPTPATSLDAPA